MAKETNRFYKNGVPDYSYVDQTNSIAEADTSGTTVTNGQSVSSIVVGANSTKEIPLVDLREYILPDSKFTLTVRTTSGTSASEIAGAVTWRENK